MAKKSKPIVDPWAEHFRKGYEDMDRAREYFDRLFPGADDDAFKRVEHHVRTAVNAARGYKAKDEGGNGYPGWEAYWVMYEELITKGQAESWDVVRGKLERGQIPPAPPRSWQKAKDNEVP